MSAPYASLVSRWTLPYEIAQMCITSAAKLSVRSLGTRSWSRWNRRLDERFSRYFIATRTLEGLPFIVVSET